MIDDFQYCSYVSVHKSSVWSEQADRVIDLFPSFVSWKHLHSLHPTFFSLHLNYTLAKDKLCGECRAVWVYVVLAFWVNSRCGKGDGLCKRECIYLAMFYVQYFMQICVEDPLEDAVVHLNGFIMSMKDKIKIKNIPIAAWCNIASYK